MFNPAELNRRNRPECRVSRRTFLQLGVGAAVTSAGIFELSTDTTRRIGQVYVELYRKYPPVAPAELLTAEEQINKAGNPNVPELAPERAIVGQDAKHRLEEIRTLVTEIYPGLIKDIGIISIGGALTWSALWEIGKKQAQAFGSTIVRGFRNIRGPRIDRV